MTSGGIIGTYPLGPLENLMRFVYDQYDGRGWSAGDTQILQYEPREEIVGTFPPYHETIRMEVDVLTHTVGLVYSAGHLVSVDRPAKVAS